jgi:RNA polymerase sigma factor (sigma-70 family)
VSEERLVAAALAGDREAFATLADRHRRPAEALVRRLLRDPLEAEDVVQEAVLRAYLGLDQLRQPARFGAWLCGIAINLARMRLRRLARSAPLPEGLAASEPADELGALREALAVLPPAQREAVVMHYVVGLSGLEIAELVGRSPGAVRVQLHRARERLRDVLAPQTPMRKEKRMVEMTVEAVLARTEGERLGEQRVIVLREREGQRLLPIFVGSPEGDALTLHLAGELPMRPFTIDLAARLLEVTGARVECVLVSRLHENVFYASIRVASEEVDARPSDALNLATRVGAPIYADEEVLTQAAVDEDGDLSAHLQSRLEEFAGPGAPAGEWVRYALSFREGFLGPQAERRE